MFHRPGFELQDRLYHVDGKREVSVRKLLAQEFVVDARLRFRPENYVFAKLDDESIENQTNRALDELKSAVIAPSGLLVAQALYEGFPLRDREPRQTLRLARSKDAFRLERFDRTIEGFDWKEIDTQNKDFNELPHARSWLAWNVESLARECIERSLKEADGLRVETRWMDDLDKLKWDASFGWYRA